MRNDFLKVGELICESCYMLKIHGSPAMNCRHMIARSVAVVSIVVVFCGYASVVKNAYAGKRASVISVGAAVKPVTKINAIFQPSTFTVTKDDIKAGYIDIPNGGSYSVVNNDRAGYKLAFATSLFSSESLATVTIETGLASPVQLMTNGTTFAPQPYKAFNTTLNLGVRFVFIKKTADSVKPGTYPWPILSVGIVPL